jgi:hypothetical protein
MGSQVKYLLPTFGACAAALLLGYLWPQPEPLTETTDRETWAWPSTPQSAAISAAPSKLSTYWPGSDTASQTDNSTTQASQENTTAHTWQLIGLIRQGPTHSAQVLDPQQQILTLSIGDALDSQRRVTAIEATRLRWQDASGAAGELLLYPQPTADTRTPPAVQPEPKK